MVNRLKSCIDYLESSRKIFNASDLAKILGKQRSYISEILNGKRKISEQFVHSFCNYFPELSPDWIMTGEGGMLKTANSIAPEHTFPLRTDNKIVIQDVPLYDFDASAGLYALFNDIHPEPIDYLRIPNLPSVDGAIYVRGDSMSPLLKSGDIVMYKKKELSIDSILWGEIYLLSFVYDGDSYTAVKYIQKSDDPDKIRLASFNPSFAPKDIPMNCVTALALVKASLTFHTME